MIKRLVCMRKSGKLVLKHSWPIFSFVISNHMFLYIKFDIIRTKVIFDTYLLDELLKHQPKPYMHFKGPSLWGSARRARQSTSARPWTGGRSLESWIKHVLWPGPQLFMLGRGQLFSHFHIGKQYTCCWFLTIWLIVFQPCAYRPKIRMLVVFHHMVVDVTCRKRMT